MGLIYLELITHVEVLVLQGAIIALLMPAHNAMERAPPAMEPVRLIVWVVMELLSWILITAVPALVLQGAIIALLMPAHNAMERAPPAMEPVRLIAPLAHQDSCYELILAVVVLAQLVHSIVLLLNAQFVKQAVLLVMEVLLHLVWHVLEVFF